MEKELNIIITTTFLSDTTVRGARLLLGCWSQSVRDPPSPELCCHTVVDSFNYILKTTPAACVGEETETQRGGFSAFLSMTVKTKTKVDQFISKVE